MSTTIQQLARTSFCSEVPSVRSKLVPPAKSCCTPFCLESFNQQPANHYLGTDNFGLAGIWPLPAGNGSGSGYQPFLNYNDITLQNLPNPATTAVGTCYRLENGGDKWGQQFDAGDLVTVHYYRSLNVRRYIAIGASVIDGGQFE